ncbi:hypothetical protein Pelo_2218 [Pelomyxa schiedti]|nr:hypothetical protein Pelo_2218 [Pelomyxa schiedti]
MSSGSSKNDVMRDRLGGITTFPSLKSLYKTFLSRNRARAAFTPEDETGILELLETQEPGPKESKGDKTSAPRFGSVPSQTNPPPQSKGTFQSEEEGYVPSSGTGTRNLGTPGRFGPVPSRPPSATPVASSTATATKPGQGIASLFPKTGFSSAGSPSKPVQPSSAPANKSGNGKTILKNSVLRDINKWYEWLDLSGASNAQLIALAEDASRNAVLPDGWEEKPGGIFFNSSTGKTESSPPNIGFYLDRLNTLKLQLKAQNALEDSDQEEDEDEQDPENSDSVEDQEEEDYEAPDFEEPPSPKNKRPTTQQTQSSQGNNRQVHSSTITNPANVQQISHSLTTAPLQIENTMKPLSNSETLAQSTQLILLKEQYTAKILEMQNTIQTLNSQLSQMAQHHAKELLTQQTMYEAQIKSLREDILLLQQQHKEALSSFSEQQKSQETLWYSKLQSREQEVTDTRNKLEMERAQLAQERGKFDELVTQLTSLACGRPIDHFVEKNPKLESLKVALEEQKKTFKAQMENEFQKQKQFHDLKLTELEVKLKAVEMDRELLQQRELALNSTAKELLSRESAFNKIKTEKEAALELEKDDLSRQKMKNQAEKEELMQLRSNLTEHRRSLERDRTDFLCETMKVSDTSSQLQAQSQQVVFMHQQCLQERKRAEEMMKEVEHLRQWKIRAEDQQRALEEGHRELQQQWARLRSERQQLLYERTAKLAMSGVSSPTSNQTYSSFTPANPNTVIPPLTPLHSPIPTTAATPQLIPHSNSMQQTSLLLSQLHSQVNSELSATSTRQSTLDNQATFLHSMGL